MQIPKLRAGSFLPSILDPRRRGDQALYGVIMETYIGGVSTRICQEIDQQVQAILSHPLESCDYAYVYLDATVLNGRQQR